MGLEQVNRTSVIRVSPPPPPHLEHVTAAEPAPCRDAETAHAAACMQTLSSPTDWPGNCLGRKVGRVVGPPAAPAPGQRTAQGERRVPTPGRGLVTYRN